MPGRLSPRCWLALLAPPPDSHSDRRGYHGLRPPSPPDVLIVFGALLDVGKDREQMAAVLNLWPPRSRAVRKSCECVRIWEPWAFGRRPGIRMLGLVVPGQLSSVYPTYLLAYGVHLCHDLEIGDVLRKLSADQAPH